MLLLTWLWGWIASLVDRWILWRLPGDTKGGVLGGWLVRLLKRLLHLATGQSTLFRAIAAYPSATDSVRTRRVELILRGSSTLQVVAPIALGRVLITHLFPLTPRQTARMEASE